MRLRFAPILLLAAGPILAFAHAEPGPQIASGGAYGGSNQSAPRRTLAGTVVNSITGEPIRRALVRVNGQGSGFAFTTPDGRFEIPNIPDGQVFLTTQKPGFFGPGTSPGIVSAPPSTITVGPATGDVVLKMEPEAKLRGHVLDKDAEPIEGLNLQLLTQVFVEGSKEWQFRGQATTDDAGAFSIENLTAGQYLVRTLALSPYSMWTGMAANAAPSEVFAPTFYPDAPDLSSAQGFELRPGQELPLDLSLSAVRGFRVNGIVTGGPLPAAVMCQDDSGQPISYSMGVDPRTGKFSIPGVPRGSWTLHAFSQQAQPDGAAEAMAPIQVTSSDVQGVLLQLQPLPAIAVHVADRPANQAMTVRLTPAAGVSQNRRYDAYQGPGDPPGSLSLHGIPPGNYKLFVRVFDNSACLASVMSGSTDLMREELTVAPGSQPPPIEITLRTDCATISGTVHSSSGQPAIGSVVLLSDSGWPNAIPAGTDGKFSFPNLPPGAYRLFAFNDVSDLEYANPEALRGFTGQAVTIGPSEKNTVQLELVTRGK